VRCIFAFYGFGTYNVLVNLNNPLVQTVLTTIVHSTDYCTTLVSLTGSIDIRNKGIQLLIWHVPPGSYQRQSP
jgi:hypothetical protein